MKLTIGAKVRYIGPRDDINKSVIYTAEFTPSALGEVAITEDSTSWTYLVHETHLAPTSKIRRR